MQSACLASLYKTADNVILSNDTQSNERMLHGLALAELVSYIEGKKQENDEGNTLIFKLADLVKMYSTCLEQLGLDRNATSRLHSTDLKNRILAQIPDLQAHKEGRDVLLAFNKDIAFALQQASRSNCDDDTIIHVKAAEIVRRDIRNYKLSEFNGALI